MSLFQFIESRIRMGRMDPVAIARASRAVRKLDTDQRLALCSPGTDGQEAAGCQLSARKIAFRDACALVNMHHRHHASPVGHLFSGGVFSGGSPCGAVIAGRPVARNLDNGPSSCCVSSATEPAMPARRRWVGPSARHAGADSLA